MGNVMIRTHIKVVDHSVEDKGRGFVLNPLKAQSANFVVDDVPLSVLAWGLMPGETVEIRRARVDSLGQGSWRKAGDCCPAALAPDDNGNLEHMAYVRCGVPVVLTRDNPQITIDDVGVFYCVFSGDGETVIERRADRLQRKGCGVAA